MTDASIKELLDTTILYELYIIPFHKTRVQIEAKLGKRYVNEYVLMELIRNFTKNYMLALMDISMHKDESVSDIIRLRLSGERGARGQTAYSLVTTILEGQPYDIGNPDDNEQIYKFMRQAFNTRMRKIFRRLNSTGDYPASCKRAKHVVRIKKKFDIANSDKLGMFFDDFDDLATCRSNCKIDTFFLARHRGWTDAITAKHEELKDNRELSKHPQFVKLAKFVKKEIVEKESTDKKSVNCNNCGQVGDAVITFSCHDEYRLNSTDRSFEYLTEIAGKEFQRHQKHRKPLSLAQYQEQNFTLDGLDEQSSDDE